MDIFMILGFCYCNLTLTLLCCKSVIAKNHAFFGVKLFCLKFGLCKGYDILQLWPYANTTLSFTTDTILPGLGYAL